MINPYAESSALERQKQQKREEILDDGMDLTRFHFAPFLPDNIKRLRVVPGEDADTILTYANLASREVEYARKRIEKYTRRHKLIKKFIHDSEGRRTKKTSDVSPQFYQYAMLDDDGYIFYWQNAKGTAVNLPPELRPDIDTVTQEISGRLALMSATKNEEMIVKTLENTNQTFLPSYHLPAQSVNPAIKEAESQ